MMLRSLDRFINWVFSRRIFCRLGLMHCGYIVEGHFTCEYCGWKEKLHRIIPCNDNANQVE
jgi:hypothetical protein